MWASEAGEPGLPNEDFLITSPDRLVLLDGGTSAGLASGCLHSVAWYVRTLGDALMVAMSDDLSLSECLATAINNTTASHQETCDPGHPGTPTATVVAVRFGPSALEYLVLADSTVAIEHRETGSATYPYTIITDDREDQIARHIRPRYDLSSPDPATQQQALRDYIFELQQLRNRPGGFWVASTDPDAADHALSGTIPRNQIRRLTALTDGASRLVDRFGIMSWPEALDYIDVHGPQGFISRTRAAEHRDPYGKQWPRGKRHDDATIVQLNDL
jgi:hypothetical protein